MKKNGNDSNKQDFTTEYCDVTVADLYVKLKKELCSKTAKYAVPKKLNHFV